MRNFRLRDILAVPFLVVGVLCDLIAVNLGGEWTAWIIIEGVKIQHKRLTKKHIL